jgi:spore maturation protein SpmA
MILIFGGLCVIPSTLIAIRSQAGSANPALILIPLLIITSLGTTFSLSLNYLAIKMKPLQWAAKYKMRKTGPNT